MPYRTLFLLLVVCIFAAFTAQAQDQEPEKVFKLLRSSSAAEDLDLEEEEEDVFWEPKIKTRQLEVSFTLGFLNMDQVLLAHDEIIYKYTDEYTYWGDVALKGSASAFSPSLRLNYNVNPFFGIEGVGNFSTCNYSSEITNRVIRTNGDMPIVLDQEPAIEEFDGERRSLVNFLGSISAVVYPLNIRGERVSRWHPYLTGGLGKIWYNMNSDYVAGTTSCNNLSFGAGVRFLAEKTVSVRMEVVFLKHDLEWDAAPYFKSLNEGTKIIDLNEYSSGPTDPNLVTSYESVAVKTTQVSLGFMASF